MLRLTLEHPTHPPSEDINSSLFAFSNAFISVTVALNLWHLCPFGHISDLGAVEEQHYGSRFSPQ